MSTTDRTGPITVDLLASSAALSEAATIRKISLRILPLIAIGYGISYIDRANVSFAALQMNRDLHFSSSIYGLGAGLFFLGYAVCELPSNLLLVRFGARRWIARIMFTWGILAMGMMFLKTPTQFYVMRMLLGVAEAGFFPGVVFYLTQWFPAEMRARAVSRFYVAVPLSSVLMGSIAGLLLSLQGSFGLAGWQWLFLIEGVPAVILSFVFLGYLPDNPVGAEWLSAKERTWLLDRVGQEQKEGKITHTNNILRALVDHRVILLAIMYFCSIGTAYAYSLSGPLIVQKLTGFNAAKVGFVVAGMSLFNALCVVLVPWHSDRSNERFWHIAIPAAFSTVGFLVAGLSFTPLIAIPALAIAQTGLVSAHPVIWSLPGSFLRDKSAAAGIAVISSFGQLGAFLGPIWIGRMRDATQSYSIGIMCLAIPTLSIVTTALVMKKLAKRN